MKNVRKNIFSPHLHPCTLAFAVFKYCTLQSWCNIVNIWRAQSNEVTLIFKCYDSLENDKKCLITNAVYILYGEVIQIVVEEETGDSLWYPVWSDSRRAIRVPTSEKAKLTTEKKFLN
jgi:hypothetical protein